MTRLNCFEVEKELWRYVDRELPASGVAAVSEHLKQCDACRKLYHDRAREANVCRSVLSESALGPESCDRIVKAMEREGLFHESPPVSTVARRHRARSNVPLPGRLALAAIFLLAATVGLTVWLSSPRAAGLGEFVADGLVRRSDAEGAAFSLFSSGRVVAGNGFVVDKGVELTLRIAAPVAAVGARLVITGPAVLKLDPASTPRSFSAVLESGMLTAQVDPRQGYPFEIRTLQARVSVVGTEFVVDASVEDVTRLRVSHGAVDFRTLVAPIGQSGTLVTPAAGEYVLRRGDRLPSLAPDSSSPSPVASSDSPEGAASPVSAADAAPEPPADDVGNVQVEPELTTEPPSGESGSAGGPSLGRPTEPVLDQVVNPGLEKDEGRRDE